jgi:hypothetical protein
VKKLKIVGQSLSLMSERSDKKSPFKPLYLGWKEVSYMQRASLNEGQKLSGVVDDN